MQALKEIIPSVMSSLQSPVHQTRNRLMDEWPQIVGPRFAVHTQPRISRNGRLLIRVDQSVLAYELHQKYSQSILKRAQAALGENEIRSVRFRVGELR